MKLKLVQFLASLMDPVRESNVRKIDITSTLAHFSPGQEIRPSADTDCPLKNFEGKRLYKNTIESVKYEFIGTTEFIKV